MQPIYFHIMCSTSRKDLFSVNHDVKFYMKHCLLTDSNVYDIVNVSFYHTFPEP